MSKGKKPKGGPSDTVNYEGLLKEQLNAVRTATKSFTRNIMYMF